MFVHELSKECGPSGIGVNVQNLRVGFDLTFAHARN